MTTIKISTPLATVIVPVYNAENDIVKCLSAIQASSLPSFELIVVDDGSTDQTKQVASSFGVTVIDSDHKQSGPGAARNIAAGQAMGEVLVFVDADVVVRPDTIARLVAPFADDPNLGAHFGSYDNDPGDPGFLSQYKNLQHHYVHQNSNRDAQTFWAGCGAVRRDAFFEAGGFDGGRFGAPSIEDIELGYRLRDSGWSIRLDPDIQACHLKRWTFGRLMHTEIFCRALPWSALMLARGKLSADLNVRWSDRVSAAAAWLIVLTLPLALVSATAVTVVLSAWVVVVVANRGFYRFLWQRRGLSFVLRSLPVHILYFLYSSACFALCWFRQSVGLSVSGEVHR